MRKQLRRRRFLFFAKVYHLMHITQRVQTGITRPSICFHGTSGFNRFIDERMQTSRRCIGDLFHANSSDLFTVLLCRNDNQCFIFNLSPPQTLFESAYIGFVNLNGSAETFSVLPNHCTTQFVKPRPGRFITPQSENSFQTQSTCAILLTGYPPYRPEPQRQKYSASLKNGTAGDRSLVSACATLNKFDTNGPSFWALISRTLKTSGPAQ